MMCIIAQKKQALENNAREKQEYRNNEIARYAEAIRALQPRIIDLLDVADELWKNRIPLGKLKKNIVGREYAEFVSNGDTHKLGFCTKIAYIQGIGIEGGGACGANLVVNREGEFVENPLNKKWYDKDAAYFDYCKKCKRFLDEFDEFEMRVVDYVKNLMNE